MLCKLPLGLVPSLPDHVSSCPRLEFRVALPAPVPTGPIPIPRLAPLGGAPAADEGSPKVGAIPPEDGGGGEHDKGTQDQHCEEVSGTTLLLTLNVL